VGRKKIYRADLVADRSRHPFARWRCQSTLDAPVQVAALTMRRQPGAPQRRTFLLAIDSSTFSEPVAKPKAAATDVARLRVLKTPNKYFSR
jgi:hypothetical protein